MQKPLLIIFFTMFPVLAHGATYYVAKTGSDSNLCANAQSQSTPKQTINAGVSCLKAGDTLIIKPGTYVEILNNVIPSGTASAPVTVKSETPLGAILRPANSSQFVYTFNTTGQYIVLDGFVMDGQDVTSAPINHIWLRDNANHITVKNCELKNGRVVDFAHGSPSAGISTDAGTSDNLFANNSIHDIGTGPCNGLACPGDQFYSYAYYWNGRNTIFEKNVVYNIAGYGVHMHCCPAGSNPTTNPNCPVDGHCNNNIIRNNVIHHCGYPADQEAILVGASGSNNLVYNNIIYASGRGVHIGDYESGPADNNQVYNNTIYQNASYYGGGSCIIVGGNATASKVRNNICYENNENRVEDRASAGQTTMNSNLCPAANTGCTVITSQTASQLFVKASGADFHLQTGSSAIDAGVDVGLLYNGSAPDLGALESGASVANVPPPTKLHHTLIGN